MENSFPSSSDAASNGSPVEVPCSNCGAMLEFAPQNGCLLCSFCGHSEGIETAKKAIVEYDLQAALANATSLPAQQLMHGGHEIECKSCGARVILQVQATRCALCDSTSVPRKYVRELEPWPLEDLIPYNGKFLSGFIAERYSVSLEEGFDLAEDRMEPVIESAICSDIGGDEQPIWRSSHPWSDYLLLG